MKTINKAYLLCFLLIAGNTFAKTTLLTECRWNPSFDQFKLAETAVDIKVSIPHASVLKGYFVVVVSRPHPIHAGEKPQIFFAKLDNRGNEFNAYDKYGLLVFRMSKLEPTGRSVAVTFKSKSGELWSLPHATEGYSREMTLCEQTW